MHGSLYKKINKEVKTISLINWKIEGYQSEKKNINSSAAEEIKETRRLYMELMNRVGTLYREVGSWTGEMTGDQSAQFMNYTEMLQTLKPRRTSAMTLPGIGKAVSDFITLGDALLITKPRMSNTSASSLSDILEYTIRTMAASGQ